MYVSLSNIYKNYGDFQASKDVSLSIEKGSLVALLGPSGSGKTTILRMIAGLETPDEGDIYINGTRVNTVAPADRGIGFLFQSYALFRYMTVFDNIAFGLTVKKASKEEIRRRVTELIDLIGLSGLEDRYPSQLSGGQRQRVAFARALAPNPDVLLLDEPFAAIDAKVKEELRMWLRHTIQQIGITTIFVTHDQEEALEMADQIVVTNKGRIEQVGTPQEIYCNPETPFVAKFLGKSSVVEGYDVLKGFQKIDNVKEALIRPEYISIHPQGSLHRYRSVVELGHIEHILFKGNRLEVTLRIGELILVANHTIDGYTFKIGDAVDVLISRICIYDDNATYLVENEGMNTSSLFYI